jgi:paraquat-inducible protein A
MNTLVACHECDLLQQEVVLPPGGTALCARCKAVLYSNRRNSLDRALAFATGAAVLFAVANAFPIVGLQVNGELIQTTLFGAARSLYADGMHTLAAVVLVTTVVAPLIELTALIALLLPLKLDRPARYSASLYRALRAIQPWRMVEVMMLGVLVALVKLAHLAEVIPGIALFALAGVVILLAACLSTFEPRILWAKLDLAR